LTTILWNGLAGESLPQAKPFRGDEFFRSDALFNLIHAYHRIFYEHRGTFINWATAMPGKVGRVCTGVDR
jgi:hypothetical protein